MDVKKEVGAFCTKAHAAGLRCSVAFQTFLAASEAEGGAGGIEAVYDLIASGHTFATLAKLWGVSPPFCAAQVRRVSDPARMATAWRARAELLAEETLELADAAPPTRDGISKAREQIAARQWLAGADNARFRKATEGPTINIDLGASHLEALIRRRVAPPLSLKEAVVEAVEGPPAEQRSLPAAIPDAATT